MVSFDPNYEGVIQHCESCGRKMSSFEIGTDRLTAEDHPDRGLCSDCRPGIDKKMEAAEKRLESLGPVSSEEVDKEIRNLLNEESELPGGFCPDCLKNPCVCKDEHPNSHYSDSPDEYEFQGNVVRDYGEL